MTTPPEFVSLDDLRRHAEERLALLDRHLKEVDRESSDDPTCVRLVAERSQAEQRRDAWQLMVGILTTEDDFASIQAKVAGVYPAARTEIEADVFAEVHGLLMYVAVMG